jgi:catechol 2,3-dioxygenase-like lactoylglutathione lyase family enzyme
MSPSLHALCLRNTMFDGRSSGPQAWRHCLAPQTHMTPRNVVDLKSFVPAKDFALAKRFYLDLGFTENWANDHVAEFQLGEHRFLLQNFYVKAHAENCMMHLTVDDADAWWTHITAAGLKEKYGLHTAKPPEMQPWGLRVLYLTDPTGVLWHIADRPKS